jgi:hypothetical protein
VLWITSTTMRALFRRRRDARARRAPTLLAGMTTAGLPLEPRLLLSADVLTYHNDNLRTGANLYETILTPANVNATTFGKVGQVSVDGQVYAQPLVKTGVTLPDGTTHNLVFVATEHDSVYAFDASTLAPVWHDSFIDPAHGVTAVLSTDVNGNAIAPEYGITSTPVIDASSNTLYVVSMIRIALPAQHPLYAYQIHALDLATGAEKLGGPVTIQATVPGIGAASVRGKVSFNPLKEIQRSALLLSGAVVYVSFASFDDHNPYHGWVIGYDARTLKQTTVFNVTPNGAQGGIWMSGGGPAADAAGMIYLVTGNGTFSPAAGNYGDSVLKLTPGPKGLRVADYFTPYNQAKLNRLDLDLGSGGVMLLPDQPGKTPHLLVTAGKQGTLYLINRDHMGHYNTRRDMVVQTVPGAMIQAYDTPAYFNGTIFFAGAGPYVEAGPPGGEALKALTISAGRINPVAKVSTPTFGYPGATPSVSASGTTNGIVWALDNGGWFKGKPAVLRAYDAGNITRVFYDSTWAPANRDAAGPAVKFAVPTVANGKVYVGGAGTLTLYGLLPNTG